MTGGVEERLRFEPDRTVTVLSGKVELGQGLSDALALICSEELALEPDRIRVRCGDTGATPDDGLTAGSGSMERAGAAVRDAARAARAELIRRAADRLGVPANRLQARSGAVRPHAEGVDGGPGRAYRGGAGVEREAPRGAGGSGAETGALAVDAAERPTAARAGGATVAEPLPGGNRSALPAGVPTVPGAGLDYWDLLRPEETGDQRGARNHGDQTAGVRRSSGDPATASNRSGGGRQRSALRPADRDTALDRAPNGYVASGPQGWRRVDRVVRGGGFVHDLRLPDMVHGRVLRPPGYGQRLTGLAADTARAMPGVLAVVVDGSFVAVAAEREEQAAAAHGVLAASARWQREDGRALPDDGRAALHQASTEATPILQRGTSPPGGRAATVTATYSRPFLMHAALGPSAAAARLDRDGGLTVWSHTQGPFELRAALAEALQRAPQSIRVIHVDGAGCYGHNGADDVALDAALLALAVPGRPVLVKWTREDENRWEPFGTAMIVACSAELDAAGDILGWRHEVRSHTHGTRPRGTRGHSTLLAAWHRAAPLTPPEPRNGTGLTAGPQRNAEPLYDFPALQLTTHFVPEAPVRVSALRSLGAFANVFAIESFMDELAARTGADPLAYRLRHLRDGRARRVLTEAVHAAPAGTAVPRAAGNELFGRGMAVARYKNLQACVAVACDVAVDRESGQIRLLHATVAAEAGRIIDRDGLANQLEGGFLQAASWTLKEAVRWDRTGIRSTDWDGYPVLRFSEVPPVTVRLIDRPDLPSVGAGEAAQGPTPAAIANAVCAAAGIRLRHTPFTPERVLAALDSGNRRSAAASENA